MIVIGGTQRSGTSLLTTFVKDYGLTVWPITSIRRAMSNLTSSNVLIKTDTQVKGDYGKLNYKWQYNKEIK